MLKSYWARIVLFVAVGCLLALGVSLIVPKKYEAEVQIMVDQSLPAQPVTTTAQAATTDDLLSFSRSRTIQTQMEQLGSLGVLTNAAKKVADDRGLADPANDPNSELNPVNLETEMSTTSDQSSDIIDFRLRMTDPNMVRDVAQQIYLAFVDQNEDNSRKLAEQAITSLQAQTSSITSQLKDIDSRSSALRQKSGFPDVTAAIASEVQALSLAKQARDTASGDAAGAHQTVAVLTEELAKIPKVVSQSTTTATNPIWEKLQSDLFAAEADRQALLGTYLEGNSLVRAAESRIDSIKNALKQLKRDAPASANMGPNQTYQALEAQLATAKAAAKAADQKLAVSNDEVSKREAYLQTLPPIQTELASLTRQQQALEKVYAGYQDQLKTLEAAKEGRSSPTREISEPTVLPNPVSPKPLINAAFGAIVGLLLGIASMFFSEAKRQPIRSLAALNDIAFAPVYRLIPELRQPFKGLDRSPPEPYEALLVNYLKSGRKPYRIAVVGIHKDSGASTAALNLAVSAARHGSSALLVECDPKASLARVGVKALVPGDVAQVSPLIKATATQTVLGLAGHHSGISSSISVLEADLTVIDLEPAVRSAEYAFVAPYVDEVILLVRAGKTRSVEFLQAQQALRDAGCRKVTTVLTRTSDFAVVVDSVEAEGAVSAPKGKAAEPLTEAPAVREAPAATVPEPVIEKVTERQHANGLTDEEIEQLLAPEPEVEEPDSEPSAEEHPLRRSRGAPTVSIEDFGGIMRSKMPTAPLSESTKEEASVSRTSKRSRIDTSGIDS